MRSNSFKVKSQPTGKNSIFSAIENLFNLDLMVEHGVPVAFVPYILFATFVGIFYIGNNHYAEKTVRKVNRLEVEVEELRADYTSLKADYMFSSKQSEVAKKVKILGLEESFEPPIKLIITKD